MTSPTKLRFRVFWLRLAIAYISLVIAWPLVYSVYARNLGAMSAPVVRWLTYQPVVVRSGWHDGQLAMLITVADQSGAKHDIGLDLDPIRYGFSHVTFLALVIAIPGWIWRRRLPRWLAGALAIEAFNIAVVLATVFGEIATAKVDFWPGDLVTDLLPHSLLTSHLNLVSLIGAQFVPILCWLLLFVFPQTRARDAATRVDVTPAPTRARAVHR